MTDTHEAREGGLRLCAILPFCDMANHGDIFERLTEMEIDFFMQVPRRGYLY